MIAASSSATSDILAGRMYRSIARALRVLDRENADVYARPAVSRCSNLDGYVLDLVWPSYDDGCEGVRLRVAVNDREARAQLLLFSSPELSQIAWGKEVLSRSPVVARLAVAVACDLLSRMCSEDGVADEI